MEDRRNSPSDRESKRPNESVWATTTRLLGPVLLMTAGAALMFAATRFFDNKKHRTKHVRFQLPKKRKKKRGKRRLSSERLSSLQKAWDEPEIRKIYGTLDNVSKLFREFRRISQCRDLSDVFWTKENFQSLMEQFDFSTTPRSASSLTDLLFNAVGDPETEQISFVAFLKAFGVAMRGSRKEQAQFLLRMVDPQSDGFVTPENLERYNSNS